MSEVEVWVKVLSWNLKFEVDVEAEVWSLKLSLKLKSKVEV